MSVSLAARGIGEELSCASRKEKRLTTELQGNEFGPGGGDYKETGFISIEGRNYLQCKVLGSLIKDLGQPGAQGMYAIVPSWSVGCRQRSGDLVPAGI